MNRIRQNYIIFLVLAVSLIFTSCRLSNPSGGKYAVKISGEEIPLGEYLVYLKEAEQDFEAIGGSDIWETDFDGQTAEEAAKESALNGLKMVKLSAQKADSFALALSEEEKKEASAEAESTYDTYSQAEKENISLENVVQVMCDKELYSKVYQKVTANFEINQEEFESYFTKSKQSFQESYTSYTLGIIFSKDQVQAEEALSRVKAGEDFFKIAEEYAKKEAMDLDKIHMTDYRSNLEAAYGISFDLNIGEVSGIMTEEEGYSIFLVEQKQIPDELQVRDAAKEFYEDNMKQVFFSQEYQKWVANSTVEKNPTVWAEIKIGEF